MRILAFDTASAATSVALLDATAGLELEVRDDPPAGDRPRHATRLLALIVELLDHAGGGWEAIDRIGVGVGPGTFTGLRIGVATARALAQARGTPLFGVSTLQSLAMNVESLDRANEHELVMAVLDARRGEAFAAAWRLAGDHGQSPSLAEPVLNPRALAPAALGEWVVGLGQQPLAVGPGALEFRAWLESSGAAIPASHSRLHSVSALNHCRLVTALPPTAAALDLRPQYLRLPDAELARRRRAPAGGA